MIESTDRALEVIRYEYGIYQYPASLCRDISQNVQKTK